MQVLRNTSDSEKPLECVSIDEHVCVGASQWSCWDPVISSKEQQLGFCLALNV